MAQVRSAIPCLDHFDHVFIYFPLISHLCSWSTPKIRRKLCALSWRRSQVLKWARVLRVSCLLSDATAGDGFVVTALTDAEYPRRAALSMCTSMLQEFGIKFPTARAPVVWPQLDQYLAR